jgi:hypothetical protein
MVRRQALDHEACDLLLLSPARLPLLAVKDGPKQRSSKAAIRKSMYGNVYVTFLPRSEKNLEFPE